MTPRKTGPLLFEQEAAKRSKNGVWGISRLRARRGLRALDLRKPLKRLDPNFIRFVMGCVEQTVSVLFEQSGPKRTKNAVKRVSRLRARRGLRALDPRKPLKRLDPNFLKGASQTF